MQLQKSMLRLLSIADGISLLNALFGFLAILTLFSDVFPSAEMRTRLSFSFILLAMMADGLDGIVARKTRQSGLGDYLEAMGDMVSLGIAPAVFVFTIYYESISYCVYYQSYLIIVLIVFLSLSIVRLASFHIMKQNEFFVGLPASAGTIFIIILAFFEIEFLYILLVIIIVSLALVSNVRFPKPGLKINAIATALIIITLVIGKTYEGIAPLLLFVAIAAYSITGPIYLLKKK